MKNLIPIFILVMISTIAIAGENLSLSCDGKVNVSKTLKDGTESTSEADKKTLFYLETVI